MPNLTKQSTAADLKALLRKVVHNYREVSDIAYGCAPAPWLKANFPNITLSEADYKEMLVMQATLVLAIIGSWSDCGLADETDSVEDMLVRIDSLVNPPEPKISVSDLTQAKWDC